MLDQNTDRMWYVIGAVLVGAALVLAANTLFPNLFQTMTDSFSGMIEKATTGLDGIEFDKDSGTATPTINLFTSGMPLF